MKYPEISPVFSDDQCEIISVNGHIYARFTSEESDWNSRVHFNPLFLDRWAKIPLSPDGVRSLEGDFDNEDGGSCSPSAMVASGFYYNPTGWRWRLGKDAGESIRQEFYAELEDADARYKVREYWWDLQWELDWATHPLTAVQYGWDPRAVITPENREIVMGNKPHFHILTMEEVKYLATNARRVRCRIWPKSRDSMDTTKIPTEAWSIKPFVDEVLSESEN